MGPSSTLTTHMKGQDFPPTLSGLHLLVGRVVLFTSHHIGGLIFLFIWVPDPCAGPRLWDLGDG